jgi:hypothetical protein
MSTNYEASRYEIFSGLLLLLREQECHRYDRNIFNSRINNLKPTALTVSDSAFCIDGSLNVKVKK